MSVLVNKLPVVPFGRLGAPEDHPRWDGERIHPYGEAVSDFCECGHSRIQHVLPASMLGQPGGCTGTVDTRHVTAGGSNLTPCACKQFKGLRAS